MESIFLIAFLASLAFGYFEIYRRKEREVRKVLFGNLLSLGLFCIITALSVSQVLASIDISLREVFFNAQSSGLTKIMLLVTNLMSTEGVVFFLFALFSVSFLSFRRDQIFFLALATAGGIVSINLLKNFFETLRPADALVLEASYSFPSGHATMAVIVFGAAYIFFREKVKNKRILCTLLALIIVLVAGSRLYLGVHWGSDVLGGIALGLFWLTYSLALIHPWIDAKKRA